MKIAISQSNYLPWRGFFGLISSVDLFIFLDEVQFTSRDWRSRNRIRTKNGTTWISVPVGASLSRRVCDVELPRGNWAEKHLSQILRHYEGALNYDFGAALTNRIFSGNSFETLSEFNKFWIKEISREIFKLNTRFIDSSEIKHDGQSSERILSIARELGAHEYLSGPAGRNYLDLSQFRSAGIRVSFADYESLSEYKQLYSPFIGTVSVIDLIFNVRGNFSQFIGISNSQK